MSSLIEHTLFFLALSLPIVVMSAFYSEAEDGPAFRGLPMRYARFVGACALVAVIMLAAEMLFASV